MFAVAVAFVTVTGMKEVVLDLTAVAKTAEIENQLCDFGIAGLLADESHDPLISARLLREIQSQSALRLVRGLVARSIFFKTGGGSITTAIAVLLPKLCMSRRAFFCRIPKSGALTRSACQQKTTQGAPGISRLSQGSHTHRGAQGFELARGAMELVHKRPYQHYPPAFSVNNLPTRCSSHCRSLSPEFAPSRPSVDCPTNTCGATA